jgi:AraC-like DNA-binding protein
MTIVFEERASDSPFVDTIMHGHTLSDGSTIRPAEIHWHMVLVKHEGKSQAIVVGPLTTSGVAKWGGGAEILWIRLKVGTYLPHLPNRSLLDTETPLPGASSSSFWLKGSAWQFPTYENVDTFINRLVREDVLTSDPLVHAALQDELLEAVPARTLRHRFLHTTGLTQNHIRQFERAQQAAALLREGVSILDTVYMMGYFDQPHLTRSLKRFVGKTPAQLLLTSKPCHSLQDAIRVSEYDTYVLSHQSPVASY